MITKHIVLTGGPSAGKSTSLAYLYDNLSTRGWRVILVPEAATLILGSSGRLEKERTGEYFQKAQKCILKLQRDLPKILGSVLAGDEEKVLFLYDRAELDNRAYVGDKTFASFLKETHNKTTWEVAHFYDAVIHMVTAADGAADAYTLSNNETRTETAEQAIELDKATQKAWLGHSHYTIIPNSGSFDDKLLKTLEAVLNILGEPDPIECERKWKLTGTPDVDKIVGVPVFIEQFYLQAGSAGEEARLRARTIDGHTTYYKTVKTETDDPSVRIEHENIISGETYHELLAYRKDNSARIEKVRWCFAYAGQHFELDHLTSPVDLWLLEAELIVRDQVVTLPDFLGELEEVTGDSSYSNAQLARS